jgi:hypothetical protein
MADADGDGFAAQPQRLGGHDRLGGRRIAAARQDVEDHSRGVDALLGSLSAGGLHRRQAVVAETEYLLLSKRPRQVLEAETGGAWKPKTGPR